MYITRRDILKGIAAGVFSAAVARTLQPRFAFASTGTSEPNTEKFLIVIKLSGGIDVLEALPFIGNTTVATDINARRSAIALNINPNTAMLADQNLMMAFHPAWAPIFPLFQEGRLKLIHGYGNPHTAGTLLDLSHEFNQAVQAFGDTSFNSMSSGWLARAMQVYNLNSSQVLGLGTTGGDEFVHSDPRFIPYAAKSLNNLAHVPLINQTDPNLIPDTLETQKVMTAARAIRAAHRSAHPNSEITNKVVSALEQMDSAVDFFQPINAYGGLSGNYSTSNLGNSLKGIGKCIATFNGSAQSRIFFTAYGGAEWDTHANQNIGLQTNISDLAANLAALVQDLRQTLGQSVWNRTTIMTTSEFGRRININSNVGTDHGTGGMALAMGGAVQGGLIVDPSIANLNWRNIENVPTRVHFQNLFGESLEWMGLSRDALYDPSKYERLSLGLFNGQS